MKKLAIAAALLAVSTLAGAGTASAHPAHKHGHYYNHGPHFKMHRVGLRPHTIRRKLRARGYHRIRFTDRHLPVYKARACKNGKRFALHMNRWGWIKDRYRIGRCHYGYHRPHRHYR